MFRSQALEHYRSDFSETETPFFISKKKITLLFLSIAFSLFFFLTLSLISITIPLSMEGFINTKNKVEFTATNGTAYLQSLNDFRAINFVLYRKTNQIAIGSLEDIETNKDETKIFLSMNKNSLEKLNQYDGETLRLKLMTKQKLFNLFFN